MPIFCPGCGNRVASKFKLGRHLPRCHRTGQRSPNKGVRIKMTKRQSCDFPLKNQQLRTASVTVPKAPRNEVSKSETERNNAPVPAFTAGTHAKANSQREDRTEPPATPAPVPQPLNKDTRPTRLDLLLSILGPLAGISPSAPPPPAPATPAPSARPVPAKPLAPARPKVRQQGQQAGGFAPEEGFAICGK